MSLLSCITILNFSLVNADETLDKAAYKLLQTRCFTCHGQGVVYADFYVLQRSFLVADRGADFPRYVEPGNPLKSKLWKVIDTNYMPEGEKLADDDKATIKKWIESGANFPTVVREFKFLTQMDQLEAVRNYLIKIRVKERSFQKFFSLAHLHNNASTKEEDMRIQRAGLSKALNSLNREGTTIVIPKAVPDTEDTIYAIDIRDFRWEKNDLWNAVIKKYPYGTRPMRAKELEVYHEIESFYNNGVTFDGFPWVRADWFVATATREDLYNKLMDIPKALADLNKRLGVDTVADFKAGRLLRAGVFKSGVSTQNRLMDRHEGTHGGYWVSYDFLSNSGRGNLARFPLGPKFSGNSFDARAFKHDGSEVVFALPNGLNGYMLVDDKDTSIPFGPVTVVFDKKNTGGNPLIYNGVSCMSCHKKGVYDFKDTMEDSIGLINPDELSKVDELFQGSEALARAIQVDQSRFLAAMRKAVLPMLKKGEKTDDAIIDGEFEPIGQISRMFHDDLSLADAAAELGLEKPEKLKDRLDSLALQQLGLKPLLNDATIKRSMWHSVDGGVSPFQEASKQLTLGSPIVP